MHERFVLISGCSGGGKSTLLAELGRRGYAVMEEPGRRIVKHELETGGCALPWVDASAFTRRALAMSLADWENASAYSGWVFFDRGLIDAASALQRLTGRPVLAQLSSTHPYHRQVFLTPPWPEIYAGDAERRHTFEAAVEEYERLKQALPARGYQVTDLPKTTVSERADFILAAIGAS